MSTANKTKINPVYDRTDPRGDFPSPEGFPDIDHNRLAIFWRPLIDMRQSPCAPMRLQAIAHVNRWLADRDSREWAWFSRHSVAGLRNQVIRHAGLPRYACRDPRRLPEELRSDEWRTLVDAIGEFHDMHPLRRRLVVFQLVQMSFYNVAVGLARDAQPDGTTDTDHYLYEVARAYYGAPGHEHDAIRLFDYLATTAEDPVIRLAAAGQGISVAIRKQGDLDLARRFESHGRADNDGSSWLRLLMRSRYHRAVALIRLREKAFREMRDEVNLAWEFAERLFDDRLEGTDQYVAVENRRIVLESVIKAEGRSPDGKRNARVQEACDQLLAIDPHCLHARLDVADSYASAGMYEEAAYWYSRTGELGVGAGAMAWYRAGQCYDALGRYADAANAMGRCLELDTTAVQPRAYLERFNA